MDYYAGIDVSLELSSVCVVDATGQIIREAKVASEPEALTAFFAGLGLPLTRVGLEAGPLSQWLHAGLQTAGYDVVLLETRHVKAALSAMIVKTDRKDARGIAQLLVEVREKVRFCEICGNVSEQDRCAICRDPRRNETLICVVEDAKDVAAIERTREFRGLYHVLGGAISPIAGVGPDDLRIKELMTRLASGEVTEIIIATDPNLEGEATASYLARFLRPMGLKVTRLASGLPVGGDLEYADEVTLGRAFEGRRLLDA